jgi:hypothetical protein
MYYVAGVGDMNVADRSTWCMTSIEGTTTKELRRGLRGEPFVPPRFALFVWHRGGWITESALNGKLPTAAADNGAPEVSRIWMTERVLEGQLPTTAVDNRTTGALQVRIIPLDYEDCCCCVW